MYFTSIVHIAQMVVAVKKVLYASDEESALAEAQEIVSASQ